jgi:hypothetical protein
LQKQAASGKSAVAFLTCHSAAVFPFGPRRPQDFGILIVATCREPRRGTDHRSTAAESGRPTPLVRPVAGSEGTTRGEVVKYLVLMHVDPSVIEALSEEQQQMIYDGHQAFMAEATKSGEMLSTHALGDPSQSTVVRGGGKPQVVEGPYAETKEFMGGYYLLDVESKERAIELAQRIPDARIEGLALEIRPVMFSAGADM